MAKIIKSGTAAAPVYTEAEHGLVDTVIDSALSPLNAFKESNEYVNKQDAAQQTLAMGVAAFVAGDIFGDKVPVLGGRR